MAENRQKVFGVFLATISVFIWGITFVNTKYLLRDFSSLEILFFRFLMAYAGLWILHPRAEKIQAGDNIFFALAGLSGVVLYQLSENIAIHFTSASNVSVLVSICPLFTAIVSQIFLKEKHVSLFFVIGFCAAIFGVALVCFNGSSLSFNPRGDFLALFAAICWGFYSMFVSILNKRNYNKICVTRRVFFFAVVIMLPIVFFGWKISFQGGSETSRAAGDFFQSLYFCLDPKVNAARFSKILNWGNLIFLGVFASGLCFTTWSKACQIFGTVKVTCALYLIPIVTAAFAFFALGEKVTLLSGAGTAITIVGLFLSEKRG